MRDVNFIDVDALLDQIRDNTNGYRRDMGFSAHNSFQSGRIALVGLAGCGKRTLYNSLWGWDVLGGKYTDKSILNLGVFSLMDLPENPHETEGTSFYPDDFDLIVYLIDGSAGLRSEDFQWITRLRAANISLLVVVTKTDRLPRDVADALIKDIETKLASQVLSINCTLTDSVHAQVLPAILAAHPQLGKALAGEIPTLRAHVVRYYIRESVIQTGAVFTDGMSDLRINDLVDIQRELVHQIAEIYGYKNRQADTYSLLFANIIIRHVQHILKPMQSDSQLLLWSLMGAVMTWGIGVAALYQFDPDRFLVRWKKHS